LADYSEELQKSKIEIDRHVRNRRVLLDIMREMVFLFDNDGVIEYMNRSAVDCFGKLTGQRCSGDLARIYKIGSALCVDADELSGRESTATVNGVPVEYSIVPFLGYTGVELTMVVMRDISQRIQYESEIHEFNSNIEQILKHKISELRESEEVRARLSRQVNSLMGQLESRRQADEMVGSSRKMRDMREMVYQVAKSDATILITGESGTGKELVADLIKDSSNRKDKPFLKINCNAINDSILESDLFGYEKGAFTGADARKKGKFEIVDGGTIFLDEIGDISTRMQSALLRVLQNGEIVRVGGTEPVKVDVRIIAATNVDLTRAVQEKSFRLDLYYRLNIINIDIPPLRDRKEDIVELVSHFVKHYRKAFKKEIDFVPQSIINNLLMHDWPGNVRELENLIQRAVLMATENMITEKDLLFDQNLSFMEGKNKQVVDVESKIGLLPLKGMLADFEQEIIEQALKKYYGNVAKAAAKLKVGKTALYDKMKRYNISAKVIKKGK
jgi:transcriptional regulator with PAS, ATPase and Fis domain